MINININSELKILTIISQNVCKQCMMSARGARAVEFLNFDFDTLLINTQYSTPKSKMDTISLNAAFARILDDNKCCSQNVSSKQSSISKFKIPVRGARLRSFIFTASIYSEADCRH